MKRAYALFLALLMILTGCADKERIKNVSVKDVCCPYEIKHKKNEVEITLSDGEQSGILWRVECVPEDICQVTQEDTNKEYVSRYRLSGKEGCVAQLTFTGLQGDDTVRFVLTLVVDIDDEGRTFVSSYQHNERIDNSVDADGLHYKWNVDVNGNLNFSFINHDDKWSPRGDGAGVVALSNMMSTPSGCKFSARAKVAGKTAIILVGENTQRTIHVVIQVDANGNMEVISVQEQ